MLLIGAGLLLRSFLRLRAVDPGFDARNVVTMTVSVAGRPEYVGASRDALYRNILDRVSAVPGVERASMTNHLPHRRRSMGISILRRRPAASAPARSSSRVYRSAVPIISPPCARHSSPAAISTIAIPPTRPPVVIVNRARWQRAIPERESDRPSHQLSRSAPAIRKWMTIVGVVHDVAQPGATPPDAEIYTPYQQDPRLTAYHQVLRRLHDAGCAHRQSNAESALDRVKNAVWSVDRNLPLSHVQTLEHAIGNSTWQSRFSLLLIGIFSALALILAMIGIYGVMAYEVAQRTHEIGIRMALGAGRGGIMRLIARQSLPVALIGIACGLAAAAGSFA